PVRVMSAFSAGQHKPAENRYDSQFPAPLSTHFKAHRKDDMLEMTLPKLEKSVRHTVKIE
ncbi:MAG: hypothetical protein Q8S05_01000, partial [Sulfuricella sp.]|nr:hypothetical protein [Sulfuricella sp.]